MPDTSDQLTSLRTFARTHETKLRFLITGGLNTLFGLAIFPILMLALAPWHLHYLVVLVLSNILGINFSYLTNKFLVFRTRGNYRQEYLKFISFYLIYFVLNLIALPVLIYLTGLSPIWAQTLFVITIIIGSYFWHSRITFLRPRSRP